MSRIDVDHGLDWHSWLVVITFMVVISIVIRPIRIPLPDLQSMLQSSKKQSPPPLPSPSSYSGPSPPSSPRPALAALPLDTAGSTDTTIGSIELVSKHSDRNDHDDPQQAFKSETDDHPTPLPEQQQPQRRRQRRHHLTLGIASAPVLGVLFLLATKSIDGESIKSGIVGAPGTGVEPYAVMTLFFSLAYICISLDMTGVFQFAAFWISRRGGGGGQRVFLSFFLLSTLMSGLAGNDVVVLTMTPFLVYYSHAVELVTPMAFLMAEIQTANIASMALYIGNLTNVVACQAYKISFLEYSAWMMLPCLFSVATCYLMLRINFRHEKYIPKQLKIPDIDPRSCLVDPFGAIFGMSILALSLLCLIGTSFAHVSVWIVTGPFALIMLARDIWYDARGLYKGPRSTSREAQNKALDHDLHSEEEREEESRNGKEVAYGKGGNVGQMEQGLPLPEVAVPDINIVHPITLFVNEPSMKGHKSQSALNATAFGAVSLNAGEKNSILPCNSPSAPIPLLTPATTIGTHVFATDTVTDDAQSLAYSVPDSVTPPSTSSAGVQLEHRSLWMMAFERRMPLLHAIVIRMPWAILPFTFSMFIMVEGLSDSGWIAIFAGWATKLVPNYITATYAVGFVSVLLCNLFNNVPMTILVARILQHPDFVESPLATPEVVKGCLFGLIVGSNLGACTTLISSLAGLMWDSVLRSKRSEVGFWNFFKWNMGVMPLVIIVALSVVVVELTVIY